MDTSHYQMAKIHIMNFLPLSKDAVHIYVGLIVFLGAVILWKKGRMLPACLIPVLAIACGMEVFDLIDDWRAFGYPRWSASIHDIVNTVFWPVAIVALVKIRALN
ncbi:MAG: hypothetical protein ACI9WS_003360 [Paraglaciecola psychrophila]|jgi:hypothetical protein